MAQYRPGAEREDCRQPDAVVSQDGVADRIDAAVDGVEAADFEAVVDFAARGTEAKQLRSCDRAVLPARDRRMRASRG